VFCGDYIVIFVEVVCCAIKVALDSQVM